MADERATLNIDATVQNSASVTGLEEALKRIDALAKSISGTLGGVRVPRSLPEQQAWNADRVATADALSASRTAERGGTVMAARELQLQIEQEQTTQAEKDVQKAKAQASTADKKFKTVQAQGANILTAAAAQRKTSRARTTDYKDRLTAGVAAHGEKLDAGDASFTFRQGFQTEAHATREEKRTAEAQKRLDAREDAWKQRQAAGDARRELQQQEQQQRAQGAQAAALLQSFALGGPAGAGRHLLGRGVQGVGNWVTNTGSAVAAQQAARAQYANAYEQWNTGTGAYANAVGGATPPPTPPGGMSPWMRGVGGAVGGMALVGAGMLYSSYRTLEPMTHKYAQWERQMRGSAAWGGNLGARDFVHGGDTARAATYGIKDDEYLSAKLGFLRSRGRNSPFGGKDEDALFAAMNAGLSPELAGQFRKRQGKGGGLQDLSKGLGHAIYGLSQAGLGADDLSAVAYGLVGRGDVAAAKGQTYNWESQVGLTRELSRKLGTSAGMRISEGLAGAGDNTLGGLESALKQITDVSALVGAAQEGGDIFDIRERLAGASGAKKLAWIKQQTGALGLYSQGSRQQAQDIVGMGALDTSLTGEYRGPVNQTTFSGIEAQGQLAQDRMATEGDLAESVAKLSAGIDALQVSIATVLPDAISSGVMRGLAGMTSF